METENGNMTARNRDVQHFCLSQASEVPKEKSFLCVTSIFHFSPKPKKIWDGIYIMVQVLCCTCTNFMPYPWLTPRTALSVLFCHLWQLVLTSLAMSGTSTEMMPECWNFSFTLIHCDGPLHVKTGVHLLLSYETQQERMWLSIKSFLVAQLVSIHIKSITFSDFTALLQQFSKNFLCIFS